MNAELRHVAESVIGFMPPDEGLALYEAALMSPSGAPFLEIGSYCGKSAVYLGAAALLKGTKLFSIDHHRGSDEHQPGEPFFDDRLWDERHCRIDTLPIFRSTMRKARLEQTVVAIVETSEKVAQTWDKDIALLFIDGGHSAPTAHADLDNFAPRLIEDGILAIHDVFPDPADGGRPPHEIYLDALSSEEFIEVGATGSLRILRRTRRTR